MMPDFMKHGIVVSSTEPTGAERQKLWIQKGKNLYNPNGEKSTFYYDASGNLVSGASGEVYNVTTIENPGNKYTVSFPRKIGEPYVRFAFFNKNTFISRVLINTTNSLITVPENTTKIDIRTNETDYIRFVDLQIEQHHLATIYEPYKKEKIYVKNRNDVYEELMPDFIKTSKELWRNPDTKVAFNEQTIELNSSDYDFYEIYFKSATNEPYLKYGKAPKGIGIYVTNALPQSGNYDIVVRRAIGYVDETHLNIQECMYQTVGTAGRTVNNTYLIPYAVFGYKK